MSKGLDPRHQWHLRTSFQLNGSSSSGVGWSGLGLLVVVRAFGAGGGARSEGGALSHAERDRAVDVCLVKFIALWESVVVCCDCDTMGLLWCV